MDFIRPGKMLQEVKSTEEPETSSSGAPAHGHTPQSNKPSSTRNHQNSGEATPSNSSTAKICPNDAERATSVAPQSNTQIDSDVPFQSNGSSDVSSTSITDTGQSSEALQNEATVNDFNQISVKSTEEPETSSSGAPAHGHTPQSNKPSSTRNHQNSGEATPSNSSTAKICPNDAERATSVAPQSNTQIDSDVPFQSNGSSDVSSTSITDTGQSSEALQNEATVNDFNQISASREDRKVKFFGDLADEEAKQIIDGLGKDANEFLRKQLIKEIGANEHADTLTLIQQNKSYAIRQFTDVLSDDIRKDTVKTLREVLSDYKGVTGPLLPPKMYIRNMLPSVRKTLTEQLSGDNSWKDLAEYLGINHVQIRYIDARFRDPAEEALRRWEVKSGSTVGRLYDSLVTLGNPYVADCL